MQRWMVYIGGWLHFTIVCILAIPVALLTVPVLWLTSCAHAYDETVHSLMQRLGKDRSRNQGSVSSCVATTICGGTVSSNGSEKPGEMRKGGKLESMIRAIARGLEVAQVAKLHPWPVPTVLQQEASMCEKCGSHAPINRLIYTTRTGSDFFGWTASGRVILVEAKENAKATLPIGSKSGHGLKRHQLLELQDCHRAGGLALIVWKHGDNVAVFDLDVLKRIGSGKSIRWTEIPDALKKSMDADATNFFEPYLRVSRAVRV